MTVRIIPRLDIKGPNLVKGIHLEGLRVLGRPEFFARHYYESGADELLYMDIVASLYQRNSLLEIVEKTSREIFIPLTVGGGLRTLEDIRAVLLAGADKVALNTMAIQQPALISEAAEKFGSSTILISIEAKKRPNGTYEAYTENGRERTGKDAIAWAKEVVDRGAGEIMITSIDQEGTGLGFDLELTKAISSQVRVPVIACGGGGTLSHIEQVISEGMADAVSVASILHYDVLQKEEASAFVEKRASNSRIESSRIETVKSYLSQHGIHVRLGTQI